MSKFIDPEEMENGKLYKFTYLDCIIVKGYYVGPSPRMEGEYVFHIEKDGSLGAYKPKEIQPVMTDRELFIDIALDVLSKNPTLLPEELMGKLYDEGFEAPRQVED